MASKELVPRPAAQPPAVVAAPPFEQQKMRTESGARLAGRWVKRNRHITVPLAVPPALWLAAVILNEMKFSIVMAIDVGLAVTASCVCLFAPVKWQKDGRPQPREVWYARASATLAALWLIAAPGSGFPFGTTGIVMSGILGVLGGAWGFLWWQHKRPRGKRKRDALIAKWDTWWQSHCWFWNLGGSAIVNVWIMGVTTKVEVAGLPGRHTLAHVNQVIALIESGLDGHVDVGRVRAETVPGKPNHFYLYFKQANPLAVTVEWEPSIAPRSVHDPAPAGLTETGAWKMTSLRKNAFVIGETRSGKSNHLLVRLACLTGCPDDRPVLIDLKGGRSARPVLEAAAAEYVITDPDVARTYLLMLVTEIGARSRYAYDGNEQLEATDDVPALHTLIDETHGLTSVTNGDAECSRLLAIAASQGSGVECYEEVYTQYGSLEESVRTEQTRMNLLFRAVYRVAMPEHGQFAIKEWHKLDASRLEEVGTCYVKDGPQAFAEQVRAPKMTHEMFRRIAAQNAALLGARPPLRLYCGAQMSPAGVTWQEWWDTRWLRLDPAFHAISPQYQAAVSGHPADALQLLADAAQAVPAPPAAEPGTGDARSAVARIEAELAAVHAGVPDGYRPPKVNLAPAVAAKKAAFADALAGSPERGGISPDQLVTESGMSRSWTMQMLRKLGEHEALTQLSRGIYVPVEGVDIRQAIRAVQAGNDQLLAEARQKISNAA